MTQGLMPAQMQVYPCPGLLSTSLLATTFVYVAKPDTCLNAWSGTLQVAPVFTAVEVEVLAKLARCVGGEFARQHDGLFCPGGSISNMYGEACCDCCRPQLVMQCIMEGGTALFMRVSSAVLSRHAEQCWRTGGQCTR